MSKRTNGVGGSKYVCHLDRGNGRTHCGRESSKVNCFRGTVSQLYCCRACWKRAGRSYTPPKTIPGSALG